MQEKALPIKHISARVPWHDNKWNGTFCCNVLDNSFCRILPKISSLKDPALEHDGALIRENNLPPCVSEKGTFLSPHDYSRELMHSWVEINQLFKDFLPGKYHHKPYSFNAVPFLWMMKSKSTVNLNGQHIGQIELPDANSGGAYTLLLDNKDIKSWSNNEIVVKMPSVIFNPLYRSYSPGTGNIQIFSTCNDSASTPLRINYSIINEQSGAGTKYRGNIVMVDTSSSLIFRCDTSVSHNPQAYACLKKAVREWNCYTGVNWIVAKDTAMAKDTLDGISNVYFSNTLTDSSTVMSTTSHPFSCLDIDSMAYVNDADINIRIKLPHGLTWNYDTTGITGGNVCYFYDFISHELGHGHLLGHIIDATSLMYYAFSSSQRYNQTTGLWPGPQTLYGGYDVVNTSAAITNNCSLIKLIPSTRTCTDPSLGLSNISSDNNNINVYPNPSINGEITIMYNLAENSYIQLIIYDCIGREMTTLASGHKAAGSYNEHINIAGWAQGVYMLVANINGVHQTIKFIKN